MSNGSYRIEIMEVVDNNSDHDELLDAAITYKIDGTYPSNSSKDRKRAIRKRAERLEINKGELFLLRKSGEQKVNIITEPAEQRHILEACHSNVTSGHFGITKTWKRLTAHAWLHQRIHAATDFLSITKCMYPWYARMVLCMHST